MDVAIPIVFPDYRIAVDLKPTTFDLFKDWTWDNVKIPAYKDRWEGLGHAGVCFINGKTGLTKYFEYGRYDPAGLGWVQRHSIPDVPIRDGKIALDSLVKPLHRIAVAAGHSGRIQGVYIEVEGGFPLMLKYAELRMSQNHSPTKVPYHILTNSCVHFAKDVGSVRWDRDAVDARSATQLLHR